MNAINLLPWRESARIQHKKRCHIKMCCGVLFALFLNGMFHYYVNKNIRKQNFYNQQLILAIKKEDLKRKKLIRLLETKHEILKTIMRLHELHKARATPILFFNDLMKIIPAGVVLNVIERQVDTIMISGFADTSTDITVLMQKITNAQWIREATLPEIKKQAIKNAFKVSFTLNYWRTDKRERTLEGQGG